MSPRSHSLRLAVLAVAALAAADAGSAAAPLRFDSVFADTPVSLHYRAEYRARGASHQLEAWVDRGTRLKRVTDGVLETYAVRDSVREPEYRMTVLDAQRKIVTRIDRSNLFRLGNFTDWFELAHALRHPRSGSVVEHAAAPAGIAAPIAQCDWYRLEQDGRSTTLCWSRAAALPLVMLSAQGEELWRVTSLQRGRVAQDVFAVHDEGFVRNDANSDIERD